MLKVLIKPTSSATRFLTDLFHSQTFAEHPCKLSYGDESPKQSTREALRSLEENEIDAVVSELAELPYPLDDHLRVLAVIDKASEEQDLDSAASGEFFAVVALKNREQLTSIFSPLDCRANWGKVYLVGFGPGDPELLTIKAERVLSTAHVIFYDRAVGAHFLTKYPSQLCHVGKKKGCHSKEQTEINQLLFESAVSGKTTVRLKGGDPGIFGRGGEETDYLLSRQVDVETIPGVTAVCAAGAAFNIPLTKRGVSSTLTITTAHGHRPNMSRIGEEETRVYYMGASELPGLSTALIDAGSDPSLPVVLVRTFGIGPRCRIHTTIGEMAEIIVEPPITIIIGKVLL